MREPDSRNDPLSQWLRLKARQPAKGVQLACLGLVLLGLLLAITGALAANRAARPLLPAGLVVGVAGALALRRATRAMPPPPDARPACATPSTRHHDAEPERFAGPLPEGEPVAFYSLAGWPLMTLTPSGGGLAVMGLDRNTGVLVPRYDLLTRIREGAADLDQLDMPAFRALLRRWRERLMREHCAQARAWVPTGHGEFPLRGEIGGQPARIRINDFPAEPMYSVIVAGQNIGNLDDWPAAWTEIKPGP